MSTWSTHTNVDGSPDDVITVLSDPDSIRRWSPIDFRLDGIDGERLEAGTNARVSGRLAGRTVAFEVDVEQAGDGRFALAASGPIDLDVEYEAFEDEAGTQVWATVSVRGGGLMGRVLAQATDALLAAGALDRALGRIADEIEIATGAGVALAA
ncbi:MAG: SRPBCC family protein [Actinomycetota bacterium]|nr:SRPBCC family protein [Actinomycetota bacterium]